MDLHQRVPPRAGRVGALPQSSSCLGRLPPFISVGETHGVSRYSLFQRTRAGERGRSQGLSTITVGSSWGIGLQEHAWVSRRGGTRRAVDLLAPVKAFDRLQRRHRLLALPLAVIKKFSDDQAGAHSALIAYYGFFSLFPMLLLFTSILGFVLQGHPHAEQSIVHSTLKQIPLIGADIGNQHTRLRGSGAGVVIGALGTVLGGLGVTLAAQNAFNRVYAVPYKERPDFLFSRLRGLGLLATIGALQIVSTAASGLVAGGLGGVLLTIGGVLLSLLLNLLLFFVSFRMLTDNVVPTRELFPGVLAATVLWTILQALGGIYVNHVLKGAKETYGTFATVIGLLTWLYLGARVVVYSAELNTVLNRKLWPRGLFDPPTEADQQTLAALAKVEERNDREQVDVEFHPDATDH
jgi:membrane protein